MIAKPTFHSERKPTDAQEPFDFPERSLHCRYKFTEANCIHGKGCKNLKEGRDCRIGMRLQRTQLITGADFCTPPTPCRMRSSCLAAQCKRCLQACCSAGMHVCLRAPAACAPAYTGEVVSWTLSQVLRRLPRMRVLAARGLVQSPVHTDKRPIVMTLLSAGAVLPILSVLADVVFHHSTQASSNEERRDALKVVRTKLTETGEGMPTSLVHL